jgi:signal transduction histidine kinase
MNAVPEALTPTNGLNSDDSYSVLSLAMPIEPITDDVKIRDVADLFLKPETQKLLSLPIVKDGEPIGVISRYNLMKVFMKKYGRELYGKRPVSVLMNTEPVVVHGSLSVSEASQYLTEHMSFPVMDDFAIVDANGYVGIGIVTDVMKKMEHQLAQNNTALLRANSEIKASQTRLIQSEKMASLGQMVAGVAHEINTPLGYVNNNVQILGTMLQPSLDVMRVVDSLIQQLTTDEPDEILLSEHLDVFKNVSKELDDEAVEDMKELLRDTLFGIEQISELVVNLKNFARLDQAKTTHININECIDSALVIGRNNLKDKVEVIKKYGELPSIPCSPSQINQVFLNLFTNAAQAMDGYGQIIIATHADDDFVNISVSDNGRGMPAEVVSRIFDPFYTTKAVGEGTGLGLSISYQIIEQHNGAISVDSEEGIGTTFHIRLPRDSAGKQY